MNELRDAALDFACRGLPVLPLHARGKRPYTRHGLRDATTDASLICAWWDQWLDANVGLATGTVAGFIALDVDNADAAEALLELAAGRELGGLVVQTGRGEQRWYSTPAGISIGNRSRLLGVAGLDVRGLGGYVVAPPSLHASGRRYAFAGGTLEPVPEWLLDMLSVRSTVADLPPATSLVGDREWESVSLERELAYGRGVLARRCDAVRTEPEGSRNYALLRAATTVAGYVASGVLNGDAARAELLTAALDAGLSELEAVRTIRSGFDRGRTRPLYPPTGAAA